MKQELEKAIEKFFESKDFAIREVYVYEDMDKILEINSIFDVELRVRIRATNDERFKKILLVNKQ